MTVERRRSTRLPVEFEVVIRYRQRRFPIAQACDLSPEGMYLRTSKLTLPTGTTIEIELDRWGRQWLIPAVVVHAKPGGVGLMFRTPQMDLYRYEMAAPSTQRPPVAGPEVASMAT